MARSLPEFHEMAAVIAIWDFRRMTASDVRHLPASIEKEG